MMCHSKFSCHFSCLSHPSTCHMWDPKVGRELTEHEKNTFKDSVPASCFSLHIPRSSIIEAQTEERNGKQKDPQLFLLKATEACDDHQYIFIYYKVSKEM